MEFGQNDNYTVKCGSNTKSFTNVDDFSRELNNGITGNLFKSTSIERDGNVITFNGIRNSKPCNLTLIFLVLITIF